MDESSAELLSSQSQNNNNNNNNDDEKSENVDDKNANALINVPNANQTELLDDNSSDLDYDSLDGDDNDRIEIETMLLQAMDSPHPTHENSTKAFDVLDDNSRIEDDNDFKHSIDNNNIPTTSNENYHETHRANDDDTKQIESHTNDMTIEPKPSDNTNHKENTESNANAIDVNNDCYDSAEEGEPIFDFLGKANEIVCYSSSRFSFHSIHFKSNLIHTPTHIFSSN